MAELANASNFSPSLGPIPARTQLVAVAWLRWRIFANGFRNRRTGQSQVAGLIFKLLVRLLVWPFVVALAIGPIIGSGALAWVAVAQHHPAGLPLLLAGIFLVWQYLSLNGAGLAAGGNTFDPASLLRFPIPFGRYLLLRLTLGLLTPMTIVGCLSLLAAAAGITLANSALAAPALIVLAIYALMNVFFARMAGLWMERWLAHRRVREVFYGLTALLFAGIQFFNFYATSKSYGAAGNWLLNRQYGSARLLQWLPPGFAANSILLQGHPLAQTAQFSALLACTALFLAALALRLHKQFLGEYLTESPARAMKAASQRLGQFPRTRARAWQPVRGIFSPVVGACLRKEWIYVTGNSNQLIGLVTPLIFVFALSRGSFAGHPRLFLPGALAFSLVGFLSAFYNLFGGDGAGVQLYLLAPIRLRDVVVAKNLAYLALVLIEAALTWCLVLWIAPAPIPLATQISTALWLVFMVGVNLTVGTLRSIQAPHRFVPGKARQARTPTSRTGSLLALGVFSGSISVQIPVILLSRHFGQPWMAVFVFAPLAAASLAAYALLLNYTDQLVLRNRDLLAEELCRQ